MNRRQASGAGDAPPARGGGSTRSPWRSRGPAGWRGAAVLACALTPACGPEQDAPTRAAPAQTLPATLLPAGAAGDATTWPALAAVAAAGLPGVRLHTTEGALVVTLAAGRFTPTLLTPPALTGRAALADGVAIVVGSGFVAELRPLRPLGLLQVDGAIASAMALHGYTRIVGVRDGRFAAIGRGDYHRGLFESALQAGPGVIEGGRLAIRPRERDLPAYFRAFVGVCAEANLAGITTVPMHLRDLGEQLLQWFEAAGLDCSEVVNLAGDREALFGLGGATATFLAGHADTAKAALIGFAVRR